MRASCRRPARSRPRPPRPSRRPPRRRRGARARRRGPPGPWARTTAAWPSSWASPGRRPPPAPEAASTAPPSAAATVPTSAPASAPAQTRRCPRRCSTPSGSSRCAGLWGASPRWTASSGSRPCSPSTCRSSTRWSRATAQRSGSSASLRPRPRPRLRPRGAWGWSGPAEGRPGSCAARRWRSGRRRTWPGVRAGPGRQRSAPRLRRPAARRRRNRRSLRRPPNGRARWARTSVPPLPPAPALPLPPLRPSLLCWGGRRGGAGLLCRMGSWLWARLDRRCRRHPAGRPQLAPRVSPSPRSQLARSSSQPASSGRLAAARAPWNTSRSLQRCLDCPPHWACLDPRRPRARCCHCSVASPEGHGASPCSSAGSAPRARRHRLEAQWAPWTSTPSSQAVPLAPASVAS
mmetsp:Transcript_54203/g.173791  ORF Transcript_54203/g.173791 Transcript_54203/m.173791 type:complete len:405 (+) Transcript_54203:521-1735(+)